VNSVQVNLTRQKERAIECELRNQSKEKQTNESKVNHKQNKLLLRSKTESKNKITTTTTTDRNQN
jgi:hypothetical protein